MQDNDREIGPTETEAIAHGEAPPWVAIAQRLDAMGASLAATSRRVEELLAQLG